MIRCIECLCNLKLRNTFHDIYPGIFQVISVGICYRYERFYGINIFTFNFTNVRVVRKQSKSCERLNEGISFQRKIKYASNSENRILNNIKVKIQDLVRLCNDSLTPVPNKYIILTLWHIASLLSTIVPHQHRHSPEDL